MAQFYSLLAFIIFFDTFWAASAYYAITGILEGRGPARGQVPLRQEVDAWYRNPKNRYEVSLFVLALAEFQAMPMDYMKSYFQIAG
jgi:tyrosinase